MTRVATEQLALVPFEAASHAALLAEWLARPHVSRWFGAAAPMTDEPGAGAVVVLCDREPAGYLCWRRVGRDALDALGLHDVPAGSIDLDIFIGDERMTGRGIGKRALGLLTAQLSLAGDVPLFGLTTQLENVAAQKAFAKAGFAKHCIYDAPGFGPCWLMVRAGRRPRTQA